MQTNKHFARPLGQHVLKLQINFIIRYHIIQTHQNLIKFLLPVNVENKRDIAKLDTWKWVSIFKPKAAQTQYYLWNFIENIPQSKDQTLKTLLNPSLRVTVKIFSQWPANIIEYINQTIVLQDIVLPHTQKTL